MSPVTSFAMPAPSPSMPLTSERIAADMPPPDGRMAHLSSPALAPREHRRVRPPSRTLWAVISALVATLTLSLAAAHLDSQLEGIITATLIEVLAPRAE